MKRTADYLDPLVNAVFALKDKQVQVYSSLSRGPRDEYAHNRHITIVGEYRGLKTQME